MFYFQRHFAITFRRRKINIFSALVGGINATTFFSTIHGEEVAWGSERKVLHSLANKKSFISGFSLHHCLFLRTLEILGAHGEEGKSSENFNPLQSFSIFVCPFHSRHTMKYARTKSTKHNSLMNSSFQL
jgi:hypothetical protein